ncbi:MAG: hypothetical protein AAF066_14270 [Pseudomonadota bacterium]
MKPAGQAKIAFQLECKDLVKDTLKNITALTEQNSAPVFVSTRKKPEVQRVAGSSK